MLMTDQASSGSERLAQRARAVIPRPVRDMLRPVVRPFLTPPAPSRRRPFEAADNWVGNRWTIEADGRTHKFFFISGCYKSGTNWVQNILNLHPLVNSKGEFHFDAILRGFTELTGTSWFLSAKPGLASVAHESMHDTVRRMIYTQTRDKPEAAWLGDRTPRVLRELLPGAPNITVLRDGRDVLVSWNFHHLRVKDPERFFAEFRPLADRLCPEFRADPARFEQRDEGFLTDEAWFRHHARVWADTVRFNAQAVPTLRAKGVPVHEMRYEVMHEDVQAAAAQLYEFLELDPALAAPLSRENRTLPGFDNGPAKFYRKGATGEWRQYFDERHARWFKEEAGDALVLAGYENDLNWKPDKER